MTAKKPRTARRARTRPAPASPVVIWLQSLGVMRVGLLLLAAAVMLAAPKPGTAAVLGGWKMLSTLIAPALAPIVFMVLMLDALMGRVMSGSARGAERERYRRIVVTNLVAGIALFLWWAPYFARLFRP
jgi:hypothetical protein